MLLSYSTILLCYIVRKCLKRIYLMRNRMNFFPLHRNCKIASRRHSESTLDRQHHNYKIAFILKVDCNCLLKKICVKKFKCSLFVVWKAVCPTHYKCRRHAVAVCSRYAVRNVGNHKFWVEYEILSYHLEETNCNNVVLQIYSSQ